MQRVNTIATRHSGNCGKYSGNPWTMQVNAFGHVVMETSVAHGKGCRGSAERGVGIVVIIAVTA